MSLITLGGNNIPRDRLQLFLGSVDTHKGYAELTEPLLETLAENCRVEMLYTILYTLVFLSGLRAKPKVP